MQAYRLISLAFAVLALSACDVSTPSQMTTGKIRLKEQMATELLDARAIDPARVEVIADNFMSQARGGMTLTVPYLSNDPAGDAVAKKQGAVYKAAFEQRGVPQVSVVTVAIADKRYMDKVLVTFKELSALPPKDCTRIPGYQGSDTMENADQYKMGCEMKTVMSRMIADPSDLQGKAGAQDGDSRRMGATVEGYSSGKPNTMSESFQASKVGK
jgi:type IV pilus biogenesis protein CpaD/CtpE